MAHRPSHTPIVDISPDPNRESTHIGSPSIARPNTYTLGDLKFEAIGDRLIVLEDSFDSGMGCPTCNPSGTGDILTNKTTISCPECNGTGDSFVKGAKCKICRGAKTIVCPDCDGMGVKKGGIITPDTASRRPTTGKVVSAGPGKYSDKGELIPMHVKVGDNVMYSNFSGYVVDLVRAGQNISLRIIHESEVLCRMDGHLTLSNLKGKSDIALAQS